MENSSHSSNLKDDTKYAQLLATARQSVRDGLKKAGDLIETAGDKVEHAGLKRFGDWIERVGNAVEHLGDVSQPDDKGAKSETVTPMRKAEKPSSAAAAIARTGT